MLRLRFLVVIVALFVGAITVRQVQGTADNVWYAEFYPQRFYAGTPVRRTFWGNHLKLYWGFQNPAPSIPADYFSSRYRYYLTLDRPMRYRFVTRGDDGYRLFVDGNLILDQLSGTPLARHVVEVDLNAGRHAIYLEHYENVGNASIDIQLYPVRDLPNPTATARAISTPQPNPTAQPAPTRRPATPTLISTATPPPVNANAPIQIESFTIAPNPAQQGGNVTVSWRIRNATTVDIVNLVPRGRYAEPVIVYLGSENAQLVSYTLDANDVSGRAQFELRAYNDVDSQSQTVYLPFDCAIRWFFNADYTPESSFGCPTQDARPKRISEQRFEHGWMVFFDQIAGEDSVLVFLEGGDIRIFPLEACDHSADCNPEPTDPAPESPDDLFQPSGLFADTWLRYRLPTELGWAVTPEEMTIDTFWQGTAFVDSFFYLFGSTEYETIWVIDQRNFTWSRFQP